MILRSLIFFLFLNVIQHHMDLTTIRYLGPNLWNSLKDNITLSMDLSSFENLTLKIDFAGMQDWEWLPKQRSNKVNNET